MIRISTAYFLASYFSTGGTFNGRFDSRYFKETLERYYRVLALINTIGPNYGIGFRNFSDAEREMQVHLNSLFNVTLAQYSIFLYGVSGEFRDGYYVSKYPEYGPNSTRWNLRKTIELAEKCANTPKKPFHKAVKYLQITTACETIKLTAEALQTLEKERLRIVHSCKNRYCTQEVFKEIEGPYLDIITEGETARKTALQLKPGEHFSFELPSSDR